MGQRMFVAITPPDRIVEELADFLEARPGMPWTAPEQWHLTLAFMADVPEHRIDDLTDELVTHVSSQAAVELRLTGAGAFPNPARASVIWLGVAAPAGVAAPVGDAAPAGVAGSGSPGPADPNVTERLTALSRTARNVANSVGAPPDGKAFVPHLTLARLRRPVEATKWLRILDTFTSSPWIVDQIELVASHLGERKGHRPRHETVATIPLGR